MDTEHVPPPIEIKPEDLSDETLEALIESFILREGTDYGAVEASLETKKSQVRRQLERREVRIYFEPSSETVTLVTKSQFKESLQRPDLHSQED